MSLTSVPLEADEMISLSLSDGTSYSSTLNSESSQDFSSSELSLQISKERRISIITLVYKAKFIVMMWIIVYILFIKSLLKL